MKPVLNLNLAVTLIDNPDDVVAFIQKLNDKLGNMLSTVQPPVSSNNNNHHPLVKEWCKVKGVSRVRCTEGRSPEQQAEYNLREYSGYKDDDINRIMGNTSVSHNSNSESPEDYSVADVF